MSNWALLTLDLEGITNDPKKRNQFNDEMAERKWTKIDLVTTTWRASFKDHLSREEAKDVTWSDIRAAATVAGIRGAIPAVFHFGPDQPSSEEVAKED